MSVPADMTDKIKARLAEAWTRLRSLDSECEALRSEIKELDSRLRAIGAGDPECGRNEAAENRPVTTEEKLALFRSLFRGREDVFPKRWENSKNGRSGYSPACANEWVKGVCGKPRVRCGDCPERAFLPVSDRVMLEHLKGRCVVGVYPMLKDETCWFLAVDFDEGSWREDAAAFVTTCRQYDVPAAVERSRSGKGAHVWIFFDSPVKAEDARKIGCFLITQTMSARPELSMSSYDRFIPNQDTMPKGGFGNLIALPFQDGPRQEGNSVFVDENWVSYEDQWLFLASVRRMNRDKAYSLAREAAGQGLVIGACSADSGEEHGGPVPWLRIEKSQKIEGPLPETVSVTMSQLLFIEKTGMPPPLQNQIKRLATFQNPMFYKKQAMRLSTALTPRMISCAEDHPRHIGLPRGCLEDLEELLSFHNILMKVDDLRCKGTHVDYPFHGELTSIQEKAAQSLMAYDTGICVAPPGSGKTVIGA